MKMRNGVLLLIFLLCATGCAPRAARPVGTLTAPQKETPRPPLVPPDRIEDKIRSLERMSADQSLAAPQRAMAGSLADSYREIQGLSSSPRNDARDRAVAEKLLNSLDLVERSFFAKTPALGAPPSGPLPLALYLDRRNELLRAYTAGSHSRVVQLGRKLEADYGGDALRGKVGLAYVLSLAHGGMTEEALSALAKVKDLDPADPDRVLLEAGVAEWQLNLGHRDKAAAALGDMSRSLDASQNVVASLGKKIEQARGSAPEPPPPQTPPTPQALGEGLGAVFARASDQIEQGLFDEARETLLAARKDVASSSDELRVDQALAEVDMAEEKYLSERISRITRKREGLESARELLEKERYGEAVAGIEAIEAQQGQGPELAALKDQAVEKYIHEERNRAAKAFLMARQTADRGKKAEYLRSSLNILKQLVEKYPSSSLIDKINSNIKSVEEEMAALGIQ